MEQLIGETTNTPTYVELIKDWTPEDREWLEKVVADNFRPIAAKHGRLCFGMVMQVGTAQGAYQLLMSHSQHMGNKIGNEVRHAATTMMRILEDFTNAVGAAHRIDNIKFDACKQDIERMGALSMQVPNQKSSLILPH